MFGLKPAKRDMRQVHMMVDAPDSVPITECGLRGWPVEGERDVFLASRGKLFGTKDVSRCTCRACKSRMILAARRA